MAFLGSTKHQPLNYQKQKIGKFPLVILNLRKAALFPSIKWKQKQGPGSLTDRENFCPGVDQLMLPGAEKGRGGLDR